MQCVRLVVLSIASGIVCREKQPCHRNLHNLCTHFATHFLQVWGGLMEALTWMHEVDVFEQSPDWIRENAQKPSNQRASTHKWPPYDTTCTTLETIACLNTNIMLNEFCKPVEKHRKRNGGALDTAFKCAQNSLRQCLCTNLLLIAYTGVFWKRFSHINENKKHIGHNKTRFCRAFCTVSTM